jgi:hypothetical protein
MEAKNSAGSMLVGVNGSGNAFVSGQTSGKPLILETNNTERMRIDSSGIDVTGTTTTNNLTIDDGVIEFDKPSVYGFRFLQNDAGNDLSIQQGDANNANYVTRLNIGSTGNVGIGTTSINANAKLHVEGTGDSQILIYETGTSPYTATLKLASQSTTDYGANVQYTSGAEQLTIENFGRTISSTQAHGSIRFRTKVGNSSMQEVLHINGYTGNVGIGCTPDAWDGYSVLQIGTSGALSANEDVTFLSANAYSSASGWKYVTTDEASLYQQQEGGHIWYGASSGSADAAISWAERMRITDTGTLLVSTDTASGLSNGTSNTGHSFGGGQQVNATNNDTNLILNMSNGSSNPHVQFRSDGGNTGNISTNGSAVSYNAGSDYRLKENVIPLKDGLDRLNKLNPVQFDWKKSQETDEGFIAHEVQEIVPYVVKGEKDGEKIQTMDYGKLTPLLVKAIQEQQTIIDDLKSRLDEAGL